MHKNIPFSLCRVTEKKTGTGSVRSISGFFWCEVSSFPKGKRPPAAEGGDGKARALFRRLGAKRRAGGRRAVWLRDKRKGGFTVTPHSLIMPLWAMRLLLYKQVHLKMALRGTCIFTRRVKKARPPFREAGILDVANILINRFLFSSS